MPKSDHKHHHRKSQEHEQNYQLRKTRSEAKLKKRIYWIKITPPYSKNTDMGTLIQKT